MTEALHNLPSCGQASLCVRLHSRRQIFPTTMVDTSLAKISVNSDDRFADHVSPRNRQQGNWYNPIVLDGDDDRRAAPDLQTRARAGDTRSNPICLDDDEADDNFWAREGRTRDKAKPAIANKSAQRVLRKPSSPRIPKNAQHRPDTAGHAHSQMGGLRKTTNEHDSCSPARHAHLTQTDSEHFCDDCMAGIEFHG